MLRNVKTRFRAYQLGCAGASYSYYADGHFTLIEAVITELNEVQLREELRICGKTRIDTLHITSWDQDHCSESGLKWILEYLRPSKIEIPGYEHTSTCAINCKKLILAYREERRREAVKVQRIDPPYIAGLEKTEGPGYTDIFYHPKELQEGSNDNSTIKFFRRGSFSVLSLGDVESPNIASMIRRAPAVRRETDVLILAHHGADNGFTTKKFLEDVKPSVAICTSNYKNQFDHPRQEIRDLLYEQDIKLFTTKTGDVLVESVGSHNKEYRVTNLCADSTKISSQYSYKARKTRWLSMNADTVRNILHPGTRGPRMHR
jgi:competence protein ComEC